MTLTIILDKDECRSQEYPSIVAESAPGREDEAFNNVKGACLVRISYFSKIPNQIEFILINQNENKVNL